jgi:hypothetical protein
MKDDKGPVRIEIPQERVQRQKGLKIVLGKPRKGPQANCVTSEELRLLTSHWPEQ